MHLLNHTAEESCIKHDHLLMLFVTIIVILDLWYLSVLKQI